MEKEKVSIKKYMVDRVAIKDLRGKEIIQINRWYVGDDGDDVEGENVFLMEVTDIGNKSTYRLLETDPVKIARYEELTRTDD